MASRSAYTDTDNPFGDASLSAPFVWTKNRKRPRPAAPEQLAAEAEAARIHREARDAQRAAARAEQDAEARERERANHADAQLVEDVFLARQHYARQARRLARRSALVGDRVARWLRLDLGLKDAPRERPPWEMIARLGVRELGEVLEHVKVELECAALAAPDEALATPEDLRNAWWDSVRQLATALEAEARSSQPVDDDIRCLLQGKSPDELRTLRTEIQAQIDNKLVADLEYWQRVLVRLQALLAEARLRGLIERIDSLRAPEPENKPAAGHKDNTDPGEVEGHVRIADVQTDEDMLQREKAKGMEEDEQVFSEEVEVQAQKYLWNDKYRPRKPRYYNRVATAYDWNKYNQTHYDHDNPPPKTVQGYKFNIFYPDLIDKSKPPTYKVVKTDNPDVSILRFSAGPPYEDVAFKIVNRKWEHSHKRGYRSSFDRGVLQLWFNFRRYRYRR